MTETRTEGRGTRARAPVIGVLGGTFNPPHLGHVLIPVHVLARGLADRIMVVPTFTHPLGKSAPEYARRLAWTRAAMGVHGPAVVVSDLERRLSEPGEDRPSYTIELLEAIANAHPDARIRLIVGSDIYASGETQRWHRWSEIERRFDPIVVPRAGHAASEACPLPDISSTRIRGWLAAGARDPSVEAALQRSVPAAVLAMIRAGRGRRLWLVGQGHVGTHAAPWLSGHGHEVVPIGARALVEGSASRPSAHEGAWPDGVWLLCRDPAIPAVARALAAWALPPEVPVLHAAGALPSRDPAALGGLAEAGHPVGTLHPICSLRRERDQQGWLDRAGFGIEGDDPARTLAIELVGEQPWLDLQGLDVTARRAYHGACALVANHLGVLEDAALGILVGQGHPRSRAELALGVLMGSALDNLVTLGLPDGVSGPVVRGDEATVRGHLDALDPDTAELYRNLSDRLRRLVRR